METVKDILTIIGIGVIGFALACLVIAVLAGMCGMFDGPDEPR